MLPTLTKSTGQEPRVLDDPHSHVAGTAPRALWVGSITGGGGYVSGAGLTIAASAFGLHWVSGAIIGLDTTMAYHGVALAATGGSANYVIKVVVLSSLTELANSADNGLVFPNVVVFGE
jgi:hypothetical protein